MQEDGRAEREENEGKRERDRECVRERGRSVSLAGFAAHLSEVCAAAKFEPEHQGAVCHCVHIFTLCRTEKNAVSHMHVTKKKKKNPKNTQCFQIFQCLQACNTFLTYALQLKSPTLFLSREQV